jgi:hypothetical protein
MSLYPKRISFVILALSLYGAVLNALSKDDDAADSAYWKSVYEGNKVVSIEITLTSETWDAMQLTRAEQGNRPARGGGPAWDGHGLG